MSERIKYARGKNPNSLANLRKGITFDDREKASEAGKKGMASQRAKRTMRELAVELGQEEQELTIQRNGKEVKVSMSRLEMIMRNFYKECVKNPNHKNLTALMKLRGEDTQHLEVEGNLTFEQALMQTGVAND